MKNVRKGLGRGLGQGYKNIVPIDAHIHSLSAKGCKTKMLYGKSVAMWSCPCGYGGTKGEFSKHIKNCPEYKRWHQKDVEFKKSIGLNAENYDLGVRYDARKSFYGKARVEVDDAGNKVLYSYNTKVAEILNGKPIVYGTYSQTTLGHIKEFLKQNGFKAENSKQILKDYKLFAKGDKTFTHRKYKVFEDPAHAWMKVSLKELKELGIADKITGYSYKKGDYAYLEEDADLSLFADEMEKQKSIKVEFDIHSTNNLSKVRTFPRYTLNAKMFSMYGDKWKVLNKGKQTVLLKNKKGETLTITRDEYDQYKPKRYSVQEMIESVVNAKGKKCDVASKLKHSKLPDSKFDKVQLKKGINVETEHTTSKKVAKAISKAHLIENDAYYKKFNPRKTTKDYLLNAKDMLKGKKWDTTIGKELETHRIQRELGWGKYRYAEVNLSKRNVPFEGVKYYVSGGVAEMTPIGLSKDMIETKTIRHKFKTFRRYATAKRNVSKLKKEYRKVN